MHRAARGPGPRAPTTKKEKGQGLTRRSACSGTKQIHVVPNAKTFQPTYYSFSLPYLAKNTTLTAKEIIAKKIILGENGNFESTSEKKTSSCTLPHPCDILKS